MSIHIGAKQGEIAPTVLLPGDPLRAKNIAETFLEDVFCFNEVRGMLGFTGYYEDKRVSTMGSGMGMPTLSIYVNELIASYGKPKAIGLRRDRSSGEVTIDEYAFTGDEFRRLIAYVERGGYPRWKDEERPGYVGRMTAAVAGTGLDPRVNE